MPFFRSRPSRAAAAGRRRVVTVGALLPGRPWPGRSASSPCRGAFFLTLVLMVASYLVLIELGKWLFYRFPGPSAHRRPHPGRRHLRRRAAYFSTADAAM